MKGQWSRKREGEEKRGVWGWEERRNLEEKQRNEKRNENRESFTTYLVLGEWERERERERHREREREVFESTVVIVVKMAPSHLPSLFDLWLFLPRLQKSWLSVLVINCWIYIYLHVLRSFKVWTDVSKRDPKMILCGVARSDYRKRNMWQLSWCIHYNTVKADSSPGCWCSPPLYLQPSWIMQAETSLKCKIWHYLVPGFNAESMHGGLAL